VSVLVYGIFVDPLYSTISVAATQAKGKGSKSKKTEVVDSDDEVEIVE
jgi:hypothetical protein